MAEGVLVEPAAAEIRHDGLDVGSGGSQVTVEAVAATKIGALWRRVAAERAVLPAKRTWWPVLEQWCSGSGEALANHCYAA